MKFKELFNTKNIKTNQSFVIAEIGHNHKGSIDTAKKLFLTAKQCGAMLQTAKKRQ